MDFLYYLSLLLEFLLVFEVIVGLDRFNEVNHNFAANENHRSMKKITKMMIITVKELSVSLF